MPRLAEQISKQIYVFDILVRVHGIIFVSMLHGDLFSEFEINILCFSLVMFESVWYDIRFQCCLVRCF